MLSIMKTLKFLEESKEVQGARNKVKILSFEEKDVKFVNSEGCWKVGKMKLKNFGKSMKIGRSKEKVCFYLKNLTVFQLLSMQSSKFLEISRSFDVRSWFEMINVLKLLEKSQKVDFHTWKKLE